ncbi:isocitrate/isopropylmalate dehydrogenase family protein [Protaetiibacter larvae]|uniref:3-isopropylmalate dehydrogenase n=1 Tax=Protaetiibacter larvae TaxID=2592654 RepID=A0A5C1Y810_9MICO|nr:isocitrate/isopropylmalate dehydrogenase family protein [Protaetiibacter larvae]QEO09498.1 isocitrate/isopropylmalate dehydrogenase family protein [Protaetiibacter larvae]
MSSYRIVTIPGDGIGPEVTASALEVVEAAARAHGGLTLEVEQLDASAERWKRTGVALPDEALAAAAEADAILMGAVGLPDARHPDGREVNGDVILRLRFELDLYGGIRPVRSFPNVATALRSDEPIDYVIVRENVEGLLASSVTRIRDEVAIDNLVITATGTTKVSELAFRLAERRAGKRRVACVDKSNAVAAYAFFREVFDQVAARHPDITPDHIYVDAMTAYQVLDPQRFDVVVTENMFGDILSDLGPATVGGLGLAASGDVGDAHGMFQPSHGSAPDIAGRGIANPTATILSAAMMLDWLGRQHDDADAVELGRVIDDAVVRVLAAGQVRTPDLRGTATSAEFTAAVIGALA